MQQFVFSLNETKNYLIEDYIISNINRDIIDLVDNYQKWNNLIYSKILIIHGTSGSGKTHLCHIFHKKTNAKFITQTDIYRNLSNNLINNRNFYIIDNLDNIINQETKILHLLNLIKDNKKYLLITTRNNPRDIPIKLADLSSRINALPKIKISEPDDDLIKAILFKHFTDRHLKIDIKTINYMISRIERSFEFIKNFVEMIDKKALIEKRNISINLAKEILDYKLND